MKKSYVVIGAIGLALAIAIAAFFLMRSKEHFIQPAEQAEPTIMDAASTADWLLKDGDNYVKSMSSYDLIARAADSHAGYLQRIATAAHDANEWETDVIKNAVAVVDLPLGSSSSSSSSSSFSAAAQHESCGSSVVWTAARGDSRGRIVDARWHPLNLEHIAVLTRGRLNEGGGGGRGARKMRWRGGQPVWKGHKALRLLDLGDCKAVQLVAESRTRLGAEERLNEVAPVLGEVGGRKRRNARRAHGPAGSIAAVAGVRLVAAMETSASQRGEQHVLEHVVDDSEG